MAAEHWFDRLNKALVGNASRRHALRAAGALAAGLVFGDAVQSTAAKNNPKKNNKHNKPHKNNSKNKQKGPRKGGKRPPATPPPTNDSCAGFPTAQDREFCRFKRQECPQYALDFCIVEGDPLDPAKLAVCCPPDATCCGDVCCQIHSRPGLKCCPPEGCVNTRISDLHCGDCFIECASDEICVDGACQACPPGQMKCGAACHDLNSDRQNCGFCGRTCAADENCVNGDCVSSTQPCAPSLTYCPPQGCVDTTTHLGHCGSCGYTCGVDHPLGHCVNGQCGCNPATNYVPCLNTCIPPNYACCANAAGNGYGCSHECGPNGGCA